MKKVAAFNIRLYPPTFYGYKVSLCQDMEGGRRGGHWHRGTQGMGQVREVKRSEPKIQAAS